MRTIRNTTLLMLLLISADTGLAAVNFVSSEIDTGDGRQGYWAADMNGDLLQDILIATWSESNGRELLIYTQETNGKFSGSPWRRIEIKKDIIAFALADIRPDAGSELLFFTGSACYSLSCAKEGYAGNLKKLFDWELIKSVPDKKKIDFIGVPEDLTGDGLVDLLLPGQTQYALFAGRPGEVFLKVSILPAADVISNKNQGGSRGISIGIAGIAGFSGEGPEIYSNLLVRRLESKKPVDKVQYPPILNYGHWIPGVSTGRFNSDELEDFVYLDDIKTEKKNTKRVNLFFQSGRGELPATPNWQGNITVNDGIKMMDVNGDHLTDMVTTEMKGLNSTLYIFLNQGGRFNFEKPDHVMKLSGILSDYQVIDFNKDGFPELVLNSYSASPVKAAASGSIERRLFIFAGRKPHDSATLFDRKPALAYIESFTVSNFRSLTGERSFSGDIDGDGTNDVISVDTNGALTANRINHDLKIEAEPFFSFTPMHFISGNRLLKLNQDNRTDIIIEHQHGLTLILSQQGVRP